MARTEKDRAYDRAWYAKNAEKLRARAKVLTHANPGRASAKERKWRLAHREYELFSGARKRARKLGLPFDLTIGDIIIPELCPVLGIPLIWETGKPSGNSPSLDRLVSELGYVKDNIRVISFRANNLKGNGTAKEHELIAEYITREVEQDGNTRSIQSNC